MPDSACPQCHAELVAVEKERKVWQLVHGKRQWKKPLRCWRAQCVSCRKVFTVRSDGQIKLIIRRWPKRSGGRPSERDPETLRRIKLVSAFEKEGWSLSRMSTYVYGNSSSAYANTRKLKSANRKEINGIKATISATEAKEMVAAALERQRNPNREKNPVRFFSQP